MEHHTGPHRRVTEKNLYLLHLDKARIILIVFVIIGVVVASFLLGMNFMKNDDNSIITQNDVLMDNQNGNELVNRDMPPIPEGDNAANENVVDSSSDGKVELSTVTGSDTVKTADIFTNDNINEVIEPKSNSKKNTSSKRIASASSKERKAETRKIEARKTTKRISKARVREVSHNTGPRKKIRKSPYYAIQIASYDSRSRAMSEMRKLKSKRFDAYVDGTRVNGKRYYRVRVGPIGSRSSASQVLHKIQDYEQYEESYMVRE